ncbi:MAG: hypothetical protein U5L04_04605 [Trueperaceae bacterium]|nr:hypothetical protein [Trueperaceae bacterium]
MSGLLRRIALRRRDRILLWLLVVLLLGLAFYDGTITTLYCVRTEGTQQGYCELRNTRLGAERQRVALAGLRTDVDRRVTSGRSSRTYYVPVLAGVGEGLELPSQPSESAGIREIAQVRAFIQNDTRTTLRLRYDRRARGALIGLGALVLAAFLGWYEWRLRKS